jgi:hypothetical protein
MHGENGRPLCVVLDEGSVGAGPPVELLSALSGRPSVRVYSTGTATGARLTLGTPSDDQYYLPVTLDGPDGSVRTGIPAQQSIRALAARLAHEHDLEDATVERVLLLSSLRRTNGLVDEVVVGHEIACGPLFWQMPALNTPEEGVALLGLSLRAHGDFAVCRKDGETRVLGAETFYRAVAFGHVEPLDTWLAATAISWHAGEPRMLELVDGVATRLGRALRARDYLQVRLRAPDYRAVWDEVLFFFDVVLLQLMGALDLLARLLHLVYRLQHSERRASWRSRFNGGWVQALGQRAPTLAARAQAGQELGDVVDLIAELRNSIHEAPLSDEIHHSDGGPGIMIWGEGLIALRADDVAATILEAAERRGGLTAWGLTDRTSEMAVTFDPGLYAEQALRATTAAIADVLDMADRTRLVRGPARDASLWIPDAEDRQHAPVLFGLQPGGLRQERVTI